MQRRLPNYKAKALDHFRTLLQKVNWRWRKIYSQLWKYIPKWQFRGGYITGRRELIPAYLLSVPPKETYQDQGLYWFKHLTWWSILEQCPFKGPWSKQKPLRMAYQTDVSLLCRQTRSQKCPVIVSTGTKAMTTTRVSCNIGWGYMSLARASPQLLPFMASE